MLVDGKLPCLSFATIAHRHFHLPEQRVLVNRGASRRRKQYEAGHHEEFCDQAFHLFAAVSTSRCINRYFRKDSCCSRCRARREFVSAAAAISTRRLSCFISSSSF